MWLALVFISFFLIEKNSAWAWNDTELCHSLELWNETEDGPIEDICLFVTQVCANTTESLFNYYTIPYCKLAKSKWLAYIFMIILVAMYLYLLGTVSDRFFIPSLTIISDKLRLPPSIAGVTLLGLGNGTPDIFTTYANVRTGLYGQAFGQLIGAAMFISIFIVAVVISVKKAVLNRRPFIRDILFFILTIFSIAAIVYDHKVYWYEALIWILIYASYVAVVGVGRVIYVKFKDKDRNKMLIKQKKILEELGLDLPITHNIYTLDISEFNFPIDKKLRYLVEVVNALTKKDAQMAEDPEGYRKNIKLLDVPLEGIIGLEGEDIDNNLERNEEMNEEEEIAKKEMFNAILEVMDIQFIPKKGLVAEAEIVEDENPEEVAHQINESDSDFHYSSTNSFEPFMKGTNLTTFVNDERRKNDETTLDDIYDKAIEDKGPRPFYWRIIEYFEWDEWTWLSLPTYVMIPFVLLIHLWIPWVDEGKYFRWFYVIHPIFIMCFIFTSFDLWKYEFVSNGRYLGYAFYWFLPPSIVLSIVVFFTTNYEKVPVYNLVFVVLGMLLSMLTISAIAKELVEVLGVLGDAWNISPAIMGITVLGWGNSIGDDNDIVDRDHLRLLIPVDFVSNVLIAKKGFPSMAIAACISAPFTNMLVGIGMAMLITTIRNGPIHLQTGIEEPDLTNIHFIGLIYIVVGLIILLLSAALFRFTFPRWFSAVLIPYYLFFLLLAVLVELNAIKIPISLWNLGVSD